jgi:hypothetical protein
MAAQENWWEGSPIVAKPNKAQQVDGGVYVPPAPEKPEKPKDAPSGYRYNAQGNVEFIPGGPADPGVKGLTESESKAVGFYQRMRSSETQMKRLDMGAARLVDINKAKSLSYVLPCIFVRQATHTIGLDGKLDCSFNALRIRRGHCS